MIKYYNVKKTNSEDVLKLNLPNVEQCVFDLFKGFIETVAEVEVTFTINPSLKDFYLDNPIKSVGSTVKFIICGKDVRELPDDLMGTIYVVNYSVSWGDQSDITIEASRATKIRSIMSEESEMAIELGQISSLYSSYKDFYTTREICLPINYRIDCQKWLNESVLVFG